MFPKGYRPILIRKSYRNADFADRVAPKHEDIEKDAVSKIPGGIADGDTFSMVAKCGPKIMETTKKALSEALESLESFDF